MTDPTRITALLEQVITKWREKAMALDRVHATMGTGWWQCAKDLEELRDAVSTLVAPPQRVCWFCFRTIDMAGPFLANVDETVHMCGDCARNAHAFFDKAASLVTPSDRNDAEVSSR